MYDDFDPIEGPINLRRIERRRGRYEVREDKLWESIFYKYLPAVAAIITLGGFLIATVSHFL